MSTIKQQLSVIKLKKCISSMLLLLYCIPIELVSVRIIISRKNMGVRSVEPMMLVSQVSECVAFNIPLNTQWVTSETNLSRQLTALVLTTKNKETKHHIYLKHKGETGKTALCS